MKHILYTKEDTDAPKAIKDPNGDIALAECKICGGVEGALSSHCPGYKLSGEELDLIYQGKLDF